MKPEPQLKCIAGKATKRASFAFKPIDKEEMLIKSTPVRYAIRGISPKVPKTPVKVPTNPIVVAKTNTGGAKYLRLALLTCALVN
jgi:hypothetical protein